jgi:hypothetical protein
MLATIQKTTKAIINKAIHDVISVERRNYGQDIRLWNDRDPRVDQSFFQGSVPGFVIGNDQTIVDWNLGFELVFGGNAAVKRGMPLSQWYEIIENFRRLPKREEKLSGEAMLPITDRERVVYVSPLYGRMVFMKIMSPVLDRVTGRVIGWNVALNINSVNERVKFFTDLNDKIQNGSRHARFILGFNQVAGRSRIVHDAVQKAVTDMGFCRNVLIIGSVGAAQFIEEILNQSPFAKVSVMDDDTEALRLLRHNLSRFGKRVKIVRCNPTDLSIVPEDKFDTALILWPRMSHQTLEKVLVVIRRKLIDATRVSIISWVDGLGCAKFWDAVRRDLEERHEVDLVRWHMGLIKEESAKSGAVALEAGAFIAPGLAQVLG